MSVVPVDVAAMEAPVESMAEKPGSAKAPQSVVVMVELPVSMIVGDEVATVVVPVPPEPVVVPVPPVPVEVAVE